MKEEKVLEKQEEKVEEGDKKRELIKEKKVSKKKYLIITIVFIVAIVIIAILSTIFGILNKFNENIISGIKINGVDVSGMTKDEAKVKISEQITNVKNESIMLKYHEYETSILAEQVGLSFNIDDVIEEAYKVGRETNIIKGSLETIKAKLNGKEIHTFMQIDEEVFNKAINDINGNLANSVEQPSYYIQESNLMIIKGKTGVSVDKEKIKELLKEKIEGKDENKIIEIPIVEEQPEDINIDKIYQEVHKEPEDAYISKDPFSIHPHVDGIDFENTLEEVKQVLSEEKDEYKIPLKITKPSKTTDMLGEEAFPDKLASYSTTYNAGDYNRSNNVELSARKINGVVLMPGEEFSYNKTLGKRTPEAGYKPAPAYVGGKTVNEYGGGICQTSSTLYNVVLLSNLEVTSRTNHCYPASYVPISRDATVSWGTLDFKFKNNRKYPIKIKSTAGGGTVKIDILGVKQEDDYEVEIQSYVSSTIGFKTQYEDNPNLEEGKEKVIQSGSNGCVGVAYKILKKNGNVISKTLLSKDTYSTKTKIVSRGTKKVQVKKEEEKKENSSSEKVTGEKNNNKKTTNAKTNKVDKNKKNNVNNTVNAVSNKKNN